MCAFPLFVLKEVIERLLLLFDENINQFIKKKLKHLFIMRVFYSIPQFCTIRLDMLECTNLSKKYRVLTSMR